MSDKHVASSVPDGGWAIELERADAKSKTEKTAISMLRVSSAAFHLRKWRKCKNAANFGLSMITEEDEEDTKNKLLEFQKIATKEHEAEQNRPNRSRLKAFLERLSKADQSIDDCPVLHQTYGNLNFVHCATHTGDIHVLEQVVAFGAAIDFPVLDVECEEGIFAAPPGCSALLLVCATLAMYGQLGTGLPLPRKQRDALNKSLECAIALVRLGANCDSKLERPPQHSSNNSFDPDVKLFETFGLFGKTARELAELSKRSSLINAMKEFKSKEDLINKAHCRCALASLSCW